MDYAIMKYKKLRYRVLCKRTSNNIRRKVKLSGLQILHAGLIVFLVPSVLCVPDFFGRLTYEKIFNTTKYVQLQHKPRPYSLSSTSNFTSSPVDINYHSDLEDSRGNELDTEDDFEDKGRGPLLVGFARDPFRYSIPEKDYLNGVRYINPDSLVSMGENRGKRGVAHLYNMMLCATGCRPLSYKGYGCYCGVGGSGKPMDGIDRCCQLHDKCYENIHCPFYTVYFQPYYWTCYRGEPLCARENYLTRHSFINGCAARLCECDRQFAMCIRQYRCPRRRALCVTSFPRIVHNLLLTTFDGIL